MPTAAQDPVAQLPSGVEYTHQQITDGPWSIHVLKIDRTNSDFRFATTLAKDHVFGLSTVRDQVGSLMHDDCKVLAAINGDFFHIRQGPYQGDPIGIQIVEGELVSDPAGVSFWIDSDGQPNIENVEPFFTANGPNDFRVTFGFNEARAENAAVLYTPTLGESTRTEGGVEYVLQKKDDAEWLPIRTDGSYNCIVADIYNDGNGSIPPDSTVLSLGPLLAAQLPKLDRGSPITLNIESRPSLRNVDVAIGGGPILIKNGKVGEWNPPQPRHPRTAIGWNETHFFLIVVDGRQEKLSVGMTFLELAQLMERLGCVDALNLDGGGSSTMWLGGKIMNSPSDGRERSVANSLLIVSPEKPNPN